MKINKKDLKIEYTKGKGPGGQNKNKVSSCVKITHIPTGITVMKDGRNQGQNKKMALKELKRRLTELKLEQKATQKKQNRDFRIRNTKTIRTYDFKKQLVKDHRTGKVAPLKEVLEKGKLDLLN